MNNLLQKVENDIVMFLTNQKIFFFNERDLQVNLALYLIKDRGYKVELEYHIPKSEFIDYPWDEENLSIDLVVEENGKYVPIELKYKTCSLPKECKVLRFGNRKLNASDIVKNQSARDVGCYLFWKDVKRLELLKKTYDNVAGGIALILTNDEKYKSHPTTKVGYYDFRILDGQYIGPNLSWRDRKGNLIQWEKQPRPNFNLSKQYKVNQWQQYTSNSDFGNYEMFYNIMLVK